jgi:hypothetical protein
MSVVTTDPEMIRERLATAESELREAERTRGDTVLDGGDPLAAADRIAQATAAVEGLKDALAAWDARAVEREEAELEHGEVVARWRVLQWYSDYLERMSPVIRLREELAAAEQRAMVIGDVKGSSGMVNHWHPWMCDELESGRLPVAATSEIPDHSTVGNPSRAEPGTLTVEDCERLTKMLAPLVKKAAAALGAEANRANLPWETS